MKNMEMETEIDDAVEKFYEINNITEENYTSSRDKAYKEGKIYDSKIVDLQEKLECWIERFEKNDKQYFIKLFKNYIYISQREFEYKIWQLCEAMYKYLEERGISKENILFVTISSPTGRASGGDSLRDNLLSANQEWGMDKSQIVSDVEKLDMNSLKDVKVIIFIDDILGTGFSLKRTIQEFIQKAIKTNFKIQEYILGVTGVFMTRSAVRFIKKKIKKEYNLEIEVFDNDNYIDSCMKGDHIFNYDEVKRIETIIERYEKEIGMDGEKNYVMGFRGCKLLLSFYYNTPNNTLCSFWKCEKNNIPVFPRDSHKKITLKALQKRKDKNRKNAYRKGCIDNENI